MQRISTHLILVLIIHVLHLAMDANNHIKIAIYKEEKCSVFEWNTFLLYVILHEKQNSDE